MSQGEQTAGGRCGREVTASSAEAVKRALSIVGQGGVYWLGTGDYKPNGMRDVPWTTNNGGTGSDCCGFAINWCYQIVRHRPGFNVGPWSSVSDDINCNSAIEDADHAQDLFERCDTPFPGALIAYPTIRILSHVFVGHVAIVTGINRVGAWDATAPNWTLLDVAQCCGPNGRGPAVIKSDGAIWSHHDTMWPKPEHRTVMLRVKSS